MNIQESYYTDRLFLRTPRLSDAEVIFDAYAQDIEVCRYMTWLPYKELEEYRNWLADKIDAIGKTAITYVICPKENDSKVVGMVDATVDSHKSEIGYALAKKEWGNGYMTEAVSSFINVILTQSNIYRVAAVCDLDNPASARVMEKSGMIYEGILRSYIVHPCISDKPRDVKSYSICKNDLH